MTDNKSSKEIKSLSQKGYLALLKLDLINVVGLKNEKREEVIKVLIKINELSWTLFFIAQGSKLNESDVENLKNLAKEKKFKELDEFLRKKYPQIEYNISYYSLLAKEMVIAQNLGKLMAILKISDIKDKEISLKEVEYLANLVRMRKWEEFSKRYKVLNKIRKSLNE